MYKAAFALLVGLMLSGCAEYVALEVATMALQTTSKAIEKKSTSKTIEDVISGLNDQSLCATIKSGDYPKHKKEAARRGLNCDVNELASTSCGNVLFLSTNGICDCATYNSKEKKFWKTSKGTQTYVQAAKRRGLNCGVDEEGSTQVATPPRKFANFENDSLCDMATKDDSWDTSPRYKAYVMEAKKRGLDCGVSEVQIKYAHFDDDSICRMATKNGSWETNPKYQGYIVAAKNRGLNCDVAMNASSQVEMASNEQSLSSAESDNEQQQQQTISQDTKIPLIDITSADTVGKQGIIRGKASDNTGIAEVTVDGTIVPVNATGIFEYSTFVPSNGLSVTVQATDLAGLTSTMSVTLERSATIETAAITFERLNPLGKRVRTNANALALIVGVSDYERTPAKAIYADNDALMFRDYASEKLGIPESRIKTLINEEADNTDILLSVQEWLVRLTTQKHSDIYIFFAGHGLTSNEERQMYLFPYDGTPKMLERTALLRDELFAQVAIAKPRSVTVFLDTCYSGITRGNETLVDDRPLVLSPKKGSIPGNFTVMTAAAGDQTAKPLEEAKHGMFSYFLMKGMEGEADANQDNRITAGELHSYVQTNVIQQSSGSQTPELQGDADRVLVQFQ